MSFTAPQHPFQLSLPCDIVRSITKQNPVAEKPLRIKGLHNENIQVNYSFIVKCSQHLDRLISVPVSSNRNYIIFIYETACI